ncbi:MAG: chaperonin GroEL [Anaerolineae bacterium]
MSSRPDVLLSQKDLAEFRRGFSEMAELAAVTYGPRGGVVANLADLRREPELLTDAATIIRRIIQMPGMARDMGAMLARHFIWRVRQDVGDGSALSAILAKAMLLEAIRFEAAGANQQLLRRGIDLAVTKVSERLKEMSVPLGGEEDYIALATALIGDAALGRVLGEVMDLVGPDGAVTIEEFTAPYLEREYVEGARVDWGLTSPHFETDEIRHEAILEQPYVYVTSHRLQSLRDITPIIALVQKAGGKALFVVADQTMNDALATLIVNNQKGEVKCASVKVEALGDNRVASMEDMAILTGGNIIKANEGIMADDVRLEDLGRARRVVVRRKDTLIIGGAGTTAAIRSRIKLIRDNMRGLKPTDENYPKLRDRIAHLSSGVAIIKIGAFGSKERKAMKEQIENALLVVSASAQEGMVPGGGAALLHCIPALSRMRENGDVGLGIQVVARALEEPMRRLAASSGQHPPIVVETAKRRGTGYGWDVLGEKVADMRAASITDPLKVVRSALETAASATTMALTTAALILHKKPSTEVEP